MMKKVEIDIYLDRSDELDPTDPLGDIQITDGKSTISEKSTYIDSWLEALIQGLKAVRMGESITLEIVEEPNSIRFEPLPLSLIPRRSAIPEGVPEMNFSLLVVPEREMTICYRGQKIETPVSKFGKALKQASQQFLREFQGTDTQRNQVFNLIANFINEDLHQQN